MKIRNPDWLLILERFPYFWLLIDEKRDCLGLVILEVLTRRVPKKAAILTFLGSFWKKHPIFADVIIEKLSIYE